MKLPLSILDLAPISSDSNASQALRNSMELAQLADRLGYTRYWLAEHHNIPSIAISTPEIMISVVASQTTRIRVGSGGIMLPNHSALKVAETFRTLEALYPGRIDLGIGRAPGTDQLTAFALRQSKERLQIDDFPDQMAELVAFGNDDFGEDHPYRAIRAIPNDVPLPPIWLLGSSGSYSSGLAASNGLGFAFAYHINPSLNDAVTSMQTYRHYFQPAEHGGRFSQPHAIFALSVLCAESDEQAEELAVVSDLAALRRQRGQFAPLPTLAEAKAYPFTPMELAQAHSFRNRMVMGGPQTVRAGIEAFVQKTGADEVMVLSMLSSHEARMRSYELLADVFELTG